MTSKETIKALQEGAFISARGGRWVVWTDEKLPTSLGIISNRTYYGLSYLLTYAARASGLGYGFVLNDKAKV